MTESRSELIEWELLTADWLTTTTALSEAENALDEITLKYLEGTGARPGRELIERVDECRHQEHQATGQMDHFIAELP